MGDFFTHTLGNTWGSGRVLPVWARVYDDRVSVVSSVCGHLIVTKRIIHHHHRQCLESVLMLPRWTHSVRCWVITLLIRHHWVIMSTSTIYHYSPVIHSRRPAAIQIDGSFTFAASNNTVRVITIPSCIIIMHYHRLWLFGDSWIRYITGPTFTVMHRSHRCDIV